MSNEIKYELINKETKQIYPVIVHEGSLGTFGNEEVHLYIKINDIDEKVTFSNKDRLGNLYNSVYAIREIGTHRQANGSGFVDNNGNLY